MKDLQRFNMNIVIYILNPLNISLYLINNIYLLMIKSSFLFFGSKESSNLQNEFNNIHLRITMNKNLIHLKDGKGIYGFLCKIDNKLYIGSSENLVKRFKEYVKGRKSNIRLQRSINKYGLNNFYFIIFKFYNSNDKTLLTDLETTYISYFNF